MIYQASPDRYDHMTYNRSGKSGINLPAISLGLWHNFGFVDSIVKARKILRKAFDLGITHFDLANNYGPPPGAAEENFGKIFKADFKNYRDEMIISTKAGYLMWPGPYGDWGSKKYLIASLNQSLRRMKLDYVDVFYSHRYDPATPLEETMGALSQIAQNGKALYIGISNYPSDKAQQAIRLLKQSGTPCLIQQEKYSMFQRGIENGLLDVLEANGVGCIVFSSLAQGLLTNRYLNGIPKDSRASKTHGFLSTSDITEDVIQKVKKLNEVAATRGQSLAQMALSWVLKDKRVTSTAIGVSSLQQLTDNIKSLDNLSFSEQELNSIDEILKESKLESIP